MSLGRKYVRGAVWAVGLTLAVSPASAESRSFAVSWVGPATNSQDGDCGPGGVNPPWEQQRLKNLEPLGYSRAEIEKMARDALETDRGSAAINAIMAMRGRLNGEPVKAVAYPESVPDPKLNVVTGRFGYGFNLDGRPAGAPGKFQDPITGEKAVDNQLFRVLGCVRVFRGTLESPATYWTYIWGQLKDSMPAWIVTIEGANLSQDGDVTVTFDRALEHLRSNIDGSPRADSTYRIDPDPRSHNIFPARMRNGEITLRDPGTAGFQLLLNPLLMHELRMSKLHLRLKLNSDGTLAGMAGGYQPWGDLYWAFAAPGASEEPEVTGDLVGIYNLFKSYADGEPDPVTGRNAAISAAYNIEGVPAFIATPSAASANR